MNLNQPPRAAEVGLSLFYCTKKFDALIHRSVMINPSFPQGWSPLPHLAGHPAAPRASEAEER